MPLPPLLARPDLLNRTNTSLLAGTVSKRYGSFAPAGTCIIMQRIMALGELLGTGVRVISLVMNANFPSS